MVKQKEISEKLSKHSEQIKKNEEDVQFIIETLKLHVDITAEMLNKVLEKLEKMENDNKKRKDEVMYQ